MLLLCLSIVESVIGGDLPQRGLKDRWSGYYGCHSGIFTCMCYSI